MLLPRCIPQFGGFPLTKPAFKAKRPQKVIKIRRNEFFQISFAQYSYPMPMSMKEVHLFQPSVLQI